MKDISRLKETEDLIGEKPPSSSGWTQIIHKIQSSDENIVNESTSSLPFKADKNVANIRTENLNILYRRVRY